MNIPNPQFSSECSKNEDFAGPGATADSGIGKTLDLCIGHKQDQGPSGNNWDPEEMIMVAVTGPFHFCGCCNWIVPEMSYGEKHTGYSIPESEAPVCYLSWCLQWSPI